MKTVRDKVVISHSLAYLSVPKWLVGDAPFYVKIWPKLTHLLQKRRFTINIARSASAVHLAKKFN